MSDMSPLPSSQATTHDTKLPATPSVRATPIYAVLPNGARRGVVVIHELFGRQPEIDRVVHRFAQKGYAVVAPDLMTGAPKPVCLVRAVRAIKRGEGEQIDQIRLARDWLCKTAGLSHEHVGVIGFCIGGGFALALGRGWGVVSTNYGDLPPDEVLRGCAPTIGCYGGRDRIFGGHGAKLNERLTKLGVPVETHTYPEVGHSFLTDGHHPIAAVLSRPMFEIIYNPAVAEAAWEKIFAFFDRYLPANAQSATR